MTEFVTEAEKLALEQEKRDDAEIEAKVRAKVRKHRASLPPIIPKPLDAPYRGPGRPKKWLVWRCDKLPNLKVFIPKWADDPLLAPSPYAEFLGTRLDSQNFAGYRNLTDAQVQQMNDVLNTTKYVRLETEVRGAVYSCDFCEYESNDPKALAYHLAINHAEQLNIHI